MCIYNQNVGLGFKICTTSSHGSTFDGVTHAMFVRRCRACGTTLMILPRRKGNFSPLKQKESRALGYTKIITYFTKSLKCLSPYI